MNSSTVGLDHVTEVVKEAEPNVRSPSSARNNVMKAIVNTNYGSSDVLEFKKVEKPRPKDNEVLVKIHAASVNAGDWLLLRGTSFPIKFGVWNPSTKNSDTGNGHRGTSRIGRRRTYVEA